MNMEDGDYYDGIKQTNESNSMSDSKKSTGKLASGTDSCTTTPVSSSNSSAAKTLIVYENDELVEIKEETIEERHQRGEHNLLSEKSQLDKKSISSDNKSAGKTEIVYEYDETLEIKEEIIQDPGAVTGQKLDKKCESTWNAVDIIEASSLATKKLLSQKENKIQDPKPEPERKYKCEKCARSYKYKKGLNTHQKFECGVTPQFICKFCDKRFKQSSHVSRHVGQVHQKKNSSQNEAKIQESKQEQEKKHNINRHQKTNSSTSQATYNCAKCTQSYSSLKSLNRHASLQHAPVKPEFTCDICGYKANRKCNLSNHISSRHLKNTTSQARHNCEKCSQSYSSLSGLHYHNLVKHAAINPQFICEVCGYRAYIKSKLSKHVSSCHFKNSKTLQARYNSKLSRARYNCDKCSKSYSSLSSLQCHSLVKHISFDPPFLCNFCGYKTCMQSELPKHVSSCAISNNEVVKLQSLGNYS